MEDVTQQFMDFAVNYGIKIVGAILILIVGRIVAIIVKRSIKRGCKKANIDPALAGFLANLGGIGLFVFAVLAALAKFGVETASFIAVLGAAGFAVGFALQGSLSNFAAGVMVLLFRPFKIGDFVNIGGEAGTVKEIGLFTTTIASPDNVKIIVPNGAAFGSTIKNFAGYETRRVDLVIGIGYDSPIDKARDLMQGLIEADTRVLKDPAYQIAVSELADSSVNFVVRAWVNAPDYWAVNFDLTEKIKKTFDQNGIEIPFPQRVVHQAK
jgi:small conductance mechanosensitive channel